MTFKEFHPAPHGVTWAHYRQVATSPDGFDASTGYEMTARFSISGSYGQMRATSINAVVRMMPADCWVIAGQKTTQLLQHERLHYVMATLVGREMERELAEVTGADGAAVQRAANQSIADNNARALEMGAAYDDDTEHGADAHEQAVWATRVQGWERSGNRIRWP